MTDLNSRQKSYLLAFYKYDQQQVASPTRKDSGANEAIATRGAGGAEEKEKIVTRQTFTEFYNSIDWTPLNEGALMIFQPPDSPGWTVGLVGEEYHATYRSAFSDDTPDFISINISPLAKWLHKKRAQLVEVKR